MILLAAFLLKIVLLLAILFAGYRMLRQRKTVFDKVIFACMALVFAFIANMVSNSVPSLTDEVTLTALNEKQEAASAAEVYLAGYTVDGEEFLAGKSMDIVEGKWFWKGETYCWRVETDTRQPEGVTRTIKVRIPVGWERTLNFEGNIWRGAVMIDAGGGEFTADTYSADGQTVKVQIGQSTKAKLILNQVVKLLAFCAVNLLAWAIVTILYRKQKNDSKYFERNLGKLIYGSITIATFGLMVYYANLRSLWNDELGRIQFSSGTLREAITCCIKMIDISPPLFEIVANPWLKIAPYGERWLLLITIVPAALSAYFAGLSGEALYGKICGVLSASLVAFASTVWGYAAYELGGYALMVFFSSLCLYSHIRKNQTKKRAYSVIYSVSLTGLCMSHYFGMLACACFFVLDVVLLARRKNTWKTVWTYVAPGLVSVVWIGIVWANTLRYRHTYEVASWYGIPKFADVLKEIRFLSGNVELAYFAVLVSVVTAVLMFFRKIGGEEELWRKVYQQFSSFCIAGTLMLLYFYGNYINSRSTMWQERYFLFLVPFVAVAVSTTVCFICSRISKGASKGVSGLRQGTVAAILEITMLINCFIAVPSSGTSQPFREAADWLYTQSNTIYNKDTLTITTMGYTDGWKYYYITRCGRRDSLNIVRSWEATEEVVGNYNVIYLQYSHMAVPESLQTILDRDFTLENDLKNINLRVYSRKTA